MVGAATIGGKDTLLIRLVNDAVLLNEAACRADQRPLVRLHNQAVDFSAIHALVLFDILLRLRQFVLLRLIFSFDLALLFLGLLLLVLFVEERVNHHVILSALQVLRAVQYLLWRRLLLLRLHHSTTIRMVI